MVKVGDGTLLPIAHIDIFILPTKHRPLNVTSVLYVSKFQHNLPSARELCGNNNCNVVVEHVTSN